MGALRRIALALTIIGAINWGLIGFFNFDLVAAIFGGQAALMSRIIYSLVGISGLICLSLLFDPVNRTEKDTNQNRQRYDKTAYATEFSEEEDLTEINRFAAEDPERENELRER